MIFFGTLHSNFVTGPRVFAARTECSCPLLDAYAYYSWAFCIEDRALLPPAGRLCLLLPGFFFPSPLIFIILPGFLQRRQSAPAPCWTLVFTTPRLFAEKAEHSCPLLDACVYYSQAFISFFFLNLCFSCRMRSTPSNGIPLACC